MVVADLHQSAGCLPVNVRELHVDFATGGSVKWLCGGPGAGYLYVRRDLWNQLDPAATGWQAHREPFAFEPGPIKFADNAMRFLNGTPNVPALYSAKSGYQIIHQVGVENIRAKSLRQTQELTRREILVDYRPQAGIRVAPHFYNTDEEVEHTVRQIREIVYAQAWSTCDITGHGASSWSRQHPASSSARIRAAYYVWRRRESIRRLETARWQRTTPARDFHSRRILARRI